MVEWAEDHVRYFLIAAAIDTEQVSVTGTVENIVERGYTPKDIYEKRVPSLVILDSISWL